MRGEESTGGQGLELRHRLQHEDGILGFPSLVDKGHQLLIPEDDHVLLGAYQFLELQEHLGVGNCSLVLRSGGAPESSDESDDQPVAAVGLNSSEAEQDNDESVDHRVELSMLLQYQTTHQPHSFVPRPALLLLLRPSPSGRLSLNLINNYYEMKKILPPSDTSFLLRLLHVPYILQMFRLVYSDPSTSQSYPAPRFELFDPLLRGESGEQREGILRLLLQRFRKDIIVGLLITFVWVALNLLIPQIIREFFSLMKMQTLEESHIHHATYITEKYVLLQVLRAFFSGHVTRAFYQLSLKVESCLSAEITGKALRINSECRTKLPESEVYHIENVDLKMIGKLFQHLWMMLEIPLTLIVAIALLFRQSLTFGVVGLYWIVLTFVIQRELSDKLVDCSLRNHELIEQRSQFNYEIMQRIRLARIDHSESLLLERNNDCFIQENKNHRKFYHYQSLFEISLILLPIVVALSISLYDHNEETSITIREVYMLLTLLGICYRPLKNLQQVMLKVEDGMHSFKRIEIYLDLPENSSKAKWIKNDADFEPVLKISRNTMTMLRSGAKNKLGTSAGFYSSREVNLHKGQRLIILGRKGQGTTIFLRSLLGEIYTVNGCIKLQGSLAYLPEVNFFRHEDIIKNIAFYDSGVPEEDIKEIYALLGLDVDLKFRKGLEEVVEVGKFSEMELKKIGLARVLCSKREVIILDCPFLGIGVEIGERLEKLLRQRQQAGAMIILTENFIRFGRDDDRIMILSHGQIKEYGRYDELLKDGESAIHSFHYAQNLALSDRISFLPIVREFQAKMMKILILQVMTEERKKKKAEAELLNKVLLGVGRYSLKLKSESQIKKQQKRQKIVKNYLTHFKFFINQLPISEWIFTTIIIISSQLLHVFIQYQIGQEYKKGGSASFGSLRKLMNYELALTLGLAIIIYFQYHVLCLTSVIIGNKVYQKSLGSLSQKDIKWYQLTHSPFIADKCNHDYEQIYIIIKYIFDFFKFSTVLVTTLLFIDASYSIIAVITTIIALYYYVMLHFFQRAEETLIKSYSIYKHDFVKVFDEIIEGGMMINVFSKNKEAFNQAKEGFISVSSYKQAINSSKIVQNLLGELTSCLIIALGLEYGTIIKIKEGEQNEALIAVSVMLLFNLSEVFKNMMQTLIRLESFFRLKLVSYIEVIEDRPLPEFTQKPLLRSNVQFCQVIVKQKQDPIFQIYPLTLSIAQGEKVILYEEDNSLRNNLLMALTNNLENFSQGRFNSDVIKIGGVNISSLSKEAMKQFLAVIMPDNYYFSGTLEQNLKWKNSFYHEKNALILGAALHLERELPEFQANGIKTEIKYSLQNHRDLSRKLALIKAILKKAKIIIIKDTPWIIGGVKVTDLVKEWKLNCTIIGITSDLTGSEGAERLVYMEKLRIIEDDLVSSLISNELSLGGALLRACKSQSYDFLPKESETNLEQVLVADVVNRSLVKSIIKFRKANTLAESL